MYPTARKPNKNTAREEKQEACGCGRRRRWRRRTGRRRSRRDDRAGGDRVVGVGDEHCERRAAERVGDGGPVGHVGRGVPGVRAIAPAHAGRKKRRKKCSATTRRRAGAASGRRRRSRRRAESPRVAGTARPRRRRRGPRRPGAATRRRAPPRGGGAREGPRGVACARKSGVTRGGPGRGAARRGAALRARGRGGVGRSGAPRAGIRSPARAAERGAPPEAAIQATDAVARVAFGDGEAQDVRAPHDDEPDAARGGEPREPRVERLGDALREHPPEADRARLSVATTVDLRRGGALSPPRG